MKKGSKVKDRRPPNRLSETKRRNILGEIARDELTVRQASDKYKVATSAIYRWQRQWGFKSATKIPEAPRDETPQAVLVTVEEPITKPLHNGQHLAEWRIRQLEHENKRLSLLVETLTEAIAEYATHAD